MRRHATLAALAATCLLAGCSLGSGESGDSASTTGGGKGSSSSTSGAGGTTSEAGPKVTGKPVTLTIAASGDILPHPGVLSTARANGTGGKYDFNPMFAQVAPILKKADLAICQLETPLSTNDTNLSLRVAATAPIINSPHTVADAVKNAGFDGCSTANNHTYDAKETGIQQTRNEMDRVGLKASGPAPDPKDQTAVYDVKGVKVAQLSYSFTLSNAIGDQVFVPAAVPWMKDNMYELRGVEGLKADAKRARDAGADFVVVSIHWGIEQTRQLSPDQLRIAPALLNSGLVDYIIGNHPHVVQQCAKINGRYVVYSNGNMLSQQGPSVGFAPMAQDGVITTVTLSRDKDGKTSQKLTYNPTYVDHNGYVITPVSQTKNPASYQRTVEAMRGDGSCDATPAG